MITGSDPFPWFKIVVDLIQPLISDSAKNADSQNQGPSENKEEGEDLNASPLSPVNQLSTTLDGSQRSAPNMVCVAPHLPTEDLLTVL